MGDVLCYLVIRYQVGEFFVVDSTFKLDSSWIFLQIVVEAFDCLNYFSMVYVAIAVWVHLRMFYQQGHAVKIQA